ncbi:MAG TPA: AAA family ATPase [Acidimicrobiales bacterium]|nr:AAA family ATPase [Acidimicrobiales bacterium]
MAGSTAGSTAHYRSRLADEILAELCRDFPAVMITGARATGKTTTAAQHVAQVVRLDEPGVAAAYRADPDAALRRADLPVLLDEWQAVPGVLGAVKRAVDRDPTPGRFVLTGSGARRSDDSRRPLVGRWFDAFATAQLRPELALAHPLPVLHHLREQGGRREVDLVVELGGSRVVALEIKATSAPTVGDARHLFWLRDRLGKGFVTGAIVHSGPGIYELGDRVYAVPLCALWS